MLSKKTVIPAVVGCLGAALLVITQTAGTVVTPQQSCKLQGAWIQTSPGIPLLATMVFSPDPSGLRASISGNLSVRITVAQAFPDMESSGEFVGEAIMTGPDTARTTIIGYGTKRAVPTAASPFDDQLVLIWTSTSEGKFTAPGKFEGINHLAYYRPDADTNSDGIPEGAPLYTIDGPTVCTRVGLPQPNTAE